MNDMDFKELLNSKNWADQTASFKREFEFGDKKVLLNCFSNYFRSPYWTVGTSIYVSFLDQAGKGYFTHEIFLSPSKQDNPLEKIEGTGDIDEYQEKVRSLIYNIYSFLNHYEINSDIDALIYDVKGTTLGEFLESFKEGIIGATKEEKDKYEAEIEAHNKKCEQFHKDNPNYFIGILLKPGLSSIFNESESPLDWNIFK